jgi:phosphate transport system substrate-binding protein
MKTNKFYFRISLAIALISLIAYGFVMGKPEKEGLVSNDRLNGTISISGAFALYPIAVKWGEEFRKLHPNVHFDISAGGAGKGISDVLGGFVDIGAVSRELFPEEKSRGANSVGVVRDAVLVTMNSSNPNAKYIASQGMKKGTFVSLFVNAGAANWQQIGFSVPGPIRVYTRADASGTADTWAAYLDSKQEDLQGTGVFGDPGLLQAVKRDVFGIGFSSIAFVYDFKTGRPLNGILPVPIDINGNGRVDPEEDFYHNLDELTKAIGNDKYPSPPARDLYFVTKSKQQKVVVTVFLKWVLTEGQKHISKTGYIALPKDKLKTELDKLETNG